MKPALATSSFVITAAFLATSWFVFGNALTYLSETAGGLPLVAASPDQLAAAHISYALAWALAGLCVSISAWLVKPATPKELLTVGSGLAALAVAVGIGWFLAVIAHRVDGLAGSGADAIPISDLALYVTGLCAAGATLIVGAAWRCIRGSSSQSPHEYSRRPVAQGPRLPRKKPNT